MNCNRSTDGSPDRKRLKRLEGELNVSAKLRGQNFVGLKSGKAQTELEMNIPNRIFWVVEFSGQISNIMSKKPTKDVLAFATVCYKSVSTHFSLRILQLFESH